MASGGPGLARISHVGARGILLLPRAYARRPGGVFVERWERRERKLKRRRQGMKVSGQGLKKVLLPIIARKAEEAKRAAAKKSRPPADSSPKD